MLQLQPSSREKSCCVVCVGSSHSFLDVLTCKTNIDFSSYRLRARLLMNERWLKLLLETSCRPLFAGSLPGQSWLGWHPGFKLQVTRLRNPGTGSSSSCQGCNEQDANLGVPGSSQRHPEWANGAEVVANCIGPRLLSGVYGVPCGCIDSETLEPGLGNGVSFVAFSDVIHCFAALPAHCRTRCQAASQ